MKLSLPASWSGSVFRYLSSLLAFDLPIILPCVEEEWVRFLAVPGVPPQQNRERVELSLSTVLFELKVKAKMDTK